MLFIKVFKVLRAELLGKTHTQKGVRLNYFEKNAKSPPPPKKKDDNIKCN